MSKTLPPLPRLPRKPRARQRSSADEESTASVTTYSIRLTERDRRILEEALEVTGWTPTHFITRATLERAAHLANTRKPKNLDFDKLARRLALQLCDPEIGGRDIVTDAVVDLSGDSFDRISFFTNTSLAEHDVTELARASNFGGAEFLAKIIDECRRLVVNRATLPEPIDPTNL